MDQNTLIAIIIVATLIFATIVFVAEIRSR